MKRWLAFILIGLMPFYANAVVYKCKGADGKITLQDRKCSGSVAVDVQSDDRVYEGAAAQAAEVHRRNAGQVNTINREQAAGTAARDKAIRQSSTEYDRKVANERDADLRLEKQRDMERQRRFEAWKNDNRSVGGSNEKPSESNRPKEKQRHEPGKVAADPDAR